MQRDRRAEAAPAPNRQRVAYQGEPGAFSEEAVRAWLGAAAEPVPMPTGRRVGRSVAEGEVRYGLLPVENSSAGSVPATHDVLAEAPLRAVAEVVHPVRHCLLGVAGASLDAVRTVRSHPVALAQCVRFLEAHPGLTAVAVHDTAGDAREVAAAGDPTQAAVAARPAAERYGLVVLAGGIQDRTDNRTRFLAVVREDDAEAAEELAPVARPVATGPRTLVMAETRDHPGALLAVLRPFAERAINLCRLESRPGGEAWRYRFYLELEGDAVEPRVRRALREAREAATALRVIRTFHAWRTG